MIAMMTNISTQLVFIALNPTLRITGRELGERYGEFDGSHSSSFDCLILKYSLLSYTPNLHCCQTLGRDE